MFCVPAPRVELLRLLPKGGTVAEIGVQRGVFSQSILDIVQPERLHLIDPWAQQTQGDYLADPSNVDDERHADHLAHVRTQFAEPIATGQVTLHRAFSQDVVDGFADGGFDWIYIDGDHTFDAVARDLALYAPKIAPGGLILGHDYNNSPPFRDQGRFGVVEAVNAFVADNDWEFVCLNMEMAATYVLARKPLAGAAELFALRLLRNVPLLFEVRDFPQSGYQTRDVDFPDGFRRQFPSFG